MADVGGLARALHAYAAELDRHTGAVTSALAQLERSLARLEGVYDGTAAREFVAHWARTTESLRTYEEGARAIRRILAERVRTLERADRAEGW